MEIRLDFYVDMGAFLIFLNHKAVTQYKPGNDILYSKGNKATEKKTSHVVVYSAVSLV